LLGVVGEEGRCDGGSVVVVVEVAVVVTHALESTSSNVFFSSSLMKRPNKPGMIKTRDFPKVCLVSKIFILA
jgi:hypothetical protein